MSDILSYDHPYVTVDGVVLRFCSEKLLEVLLIKRDSEPEYGKWSLPGGFVDIDKRLDETLLTKVSQKTGVTGYYMEQLMTYDALDRDPRGRILSVAYLALTNDLDASGDWFQIDGEMLRRGGEEFPSRVLAFDHGKILRTAIIRLLGKFWYSDLPRYILQPEFTVRDAQLLYERLGGHAHSNFKRKLTAYIEGTGNTREYGQSGGRPAALFRWASKGEK